MLKIVNVPFAAPTAVGANFTWSVTVCFGFSVTGRTAPDTEKPVPLMRAESIVSAAVPVEVSVTGSVALLPVTMSPKLK